jgi:sigma-B regulation protein RsbU (phosphoserine phosphatase)
VWRQLTQLGTQHRRWLWGLETLAGAFLVVELIAVALAVGLARRIVRSTNVLTDAAGRIAAGELGHRVPVPHRDQLGQLGAAFNRMAESIERLLEETKEKERLEEELRIARQVQESLLPQSLPQLEHTRLAALCRPARNISGDLYDVLELGPGRLGLLCADVSGKGIPAALLTANIQALVRALLRGRDGERPSPAALLSGINRELVHRIPSNAFVTMFWAEYDSRSRILRWSNAGHCPPLVLSNGEESWLAACGIPVGVLEHTGYCDEEIALPAGSTLVAYTDGVSETERADGEPFGEERLSALCRSHGDDGPAVLVERIVESVEDWSGGAEPHDDVTLLVMQT